MDRQKRSASPQEAEAVRTSKNRKAWRVIASHFLAAFVGAFTYGLAAFAVGPLLPATMEAIYVACILGVPWLVCAWFSARGAPTSRLIGFAAGLLWGLMFALSLCISIQNGRVSVNWPAMIPLLLFGPIVIAISVLPVRLVARLIRKCAAARHKLPEDDVLRASEGAGTMDAPSRRPLQWSLRALLVVVSAFAIWLGFQANAAHRQAAAVRAIRGMRGEAYYDYEVDGPDHAALEWLREHIGKDFFASVVHVSLAGTQVGDDELHVLAGLPDLETLELSYTDVGDKGLPVLKELKRLRDLGLADTRITDRALPYIGGVTELEELSLFRTGVSDEGLKHLQGLVRLKKLLLADTRVSDEGMRHLGRLKQLGYLSLSKTRVTGIGLGYLPSDNLSILHLTDTDISDQELATLQRFPELTQLLLDRTRISDRGLSQLRLSELTDLSLAGTRISDGGLSHLRQLPRLRKLSLGDTRITDQGLKQLSTFAALDSVDLRGCPNITVEGLRQIRRESPRFVMSLQLGDELLIKLREAQGVQ